MLALHHSMKGMTFKSNDTDNEHNDSELQTLGLIYIIDIDICGIAPLEGAQLDSPYSIAKIH